MKMTDEIKTPMTAEEQEAIHKLISGEVARVVLDAAEDAMRVIDEMVAIDKQSDYDMEYYDKEIL